MPGTAKQVVNFNHVPHFQDFGRVWRRNTFNFDRTLQIKCYLMNRKSVEFRRQLCFYLEFLILEDPLVSPMFNSAGVFHRENLSFIFPYGTY